MTTLLLSDLHLPDSRSPLRERFIAFCDGPARAARSVYLLGDLFEYWIGDAEGLRDYGPEAAALQRLSAAGVAVGLQPGNRDFIIGQQFADACGLDLLDDPLLLDLGGVRTLLSHGDIWCTDDIAYQRWRRFSRARLPQAIYRRLPESARERVAGAARSGSAGKPVSIMDVNDGAIRAALAASGASRIIHGHTHRPTEHALQVDGRDCLRIVLADWQPERCEYLAVEPDGHWRRLRFEG